MPTYDLMCQECGNVEIDKKVSLETYEKGIVCTKCGEMMIQTYSPVPDIWKCDGCYKTESRR